MAGPMFNLYSERFDNNREDMTSTPSPSYEEAINTNRRMLSTINDIAPYLGLRARLSQVWFNRWTVLLSLVVVRVLLATQSLNGDLDSAHREALSACTSVESMGSAMASMPHYMSQGVNELAAMGIEKAVQALENTLLLLITGVQEIVVFVINLITSTYLCLLTLAIQGSIGAVVDASAKIRDAINNTLGDLVDGVSGDLKKLGDSIDSILGKLNALSKFLGTDISALKGKIPDVSKLKNVQIPDGFQKDLQKIKDNMPTFEEVQKAANDAIRIPFQTIQQHVNESLGTYTFDRTIFPVPEKERLTFCSDNSAISDFFGGLKRTVNKVKNILVGIVVALAVLAMIPMGYMEWLGWRTTNSRARMLLTPSCDPLDVVQIASRPYSAGIGLKLAGFFRSSRHQTLVRWAVAYVTSTPALFVVSLGVAGLLGVFSQYILLRQVEIAAPELAAQVGEFAEIVVKQLTAASEKWAIQTNQAINKTSGDLNRELFGWVDNGTSSLNNTLNVFVDKMYEGVDQFLGKTPFADPIKDVLNCLIGIKVKGIQKGLTWAHDNAHISLPTLPNNTFSVGALASKGTPSSFIADPSTKAADGISAVIVRLTDKWKFSIREEAIISSCILLVWVIVLVIALVRTIMLFFTHDKHRGEIGGGPPVRANTNVTLGGSRGPPPPFPAFGGNVSPVSSASSAEKSGGPDGQWVQVGAANSRMNVEDGNRVQSVYPTYGSGGSAESKDHSSYC